jgi:chromosomal replication initiation ATPase DnaA
VDIKQVWEDAKIKIADNVSAISFTVYIESLAPEHFKNGTFTLLAPSTSYKKKALDERHFPHIEEALKDVAPIIETVAVIDAVDKEELEALAKGETKPEITAKPSIETFANPLMTFNNFVIGPSNQMA